MSNAPRSALIETALAMNASGINSGTSGNLSVRNGQGMLITPSGFRYEDLQAGDIVFIDENGEAEGTSKPSSEWRFHYDIYKQRPDAQAVLHAHPTHCATLACLNKAIPAFHYMVAVAGGRDIRCARYATFGTQDLSDHILEALVGRTACLMANHGLVCLGPDLKKVLSLAVEIEHLAKTYSQCLALGDPTILDDEEMDRVIEKFRHYGAKNVT
ncbi:MAG: L-fuculose-phosphate aldolase [Lysobacterales bacterium]|jgi:L-fuculose-phosphate aldolase